MTKTTHVMYQFILYLFFLSKPTRPYLKKIITPSLLNLESILNQITACAPFGTAFRA